MLSAVVVAPSAFTATRSRIADITAPGVQRSQRMSARPREVDSMMPIAWSPPLNGRRKETVMRDDA